MNRRTFLELGFGAATSATPIAASRLPAQMAAKGPFARRGRFERLAISTVRIEAGATRPFSVLHISDTHLTDAYPDEDEWKQRLKARSTDNFGGFQEDALRESVAWAKANCDYLVHTGDIMDWHSRKNLDLAKKYLGPDAFGAIGNHEYTLYHYLSKEAGIRKSREEIRRILQPSFPFDVTFAARVVEGVNFVSLDDTNGCVTAEQAKKFEAEVAKGLPIVLLVHVPLYTDFIWTAATKFWSSGARFRTTAVPPRKHQAYAQAHDSTTRDFVARLKTVRALKAILAGHEHISVEDRFSPTATEHLVGGNFLFQAQEVLFS